MPVRVRIQILHNANERESFFRGYAEGDSLVRVFDGEPPVFIPYREDLEVGLHFVYEANQYVGESRHPWYSDARSLCMGDVIVLGDNAYAIEQVGFKHLPGFEVPYE